MVRKGMAIYDPVPRLDVQRERLLYLLSKLLNETLQADEDATNQGRGLVVLSNQEKSELTVLLGLLVEDRSLVIGLSFVDGIVGVNGLREDQLREIYLSERKRVGRTRALASKQWADFLARIGRHSGWSRWGVSTHQMSYTRFLEMEQRLFEALHFPRRVKSYLLAKILTTREAVESALSPDEIAEAASSLATRTRDMLKQLRDMLESPIGDSSLSTNQVAGLTVVVSNLSVLFTTRDWSAAGTMSAISGGGIQLLSK